MVQLNLVINSIDFILWFKWGQHLSILLNSTPNQHIFERVQNRVNISKNGSIEFSDQLN